MRVRRRIFRYWPKIEAEYRLEHYVGGHAVLAAMIALPICIGHAAGAWWGWALTCVEVIAFGVSAFDGCEDVPMTSNTNNEDPSGADASAEREDETRTTFQPGQPGGGSSPSTPPAAEPDAMFDPADKHAEGE